MSMHHSRKVLIPNAVAWLAYFSVMSMFAWGNLFRKQFDSARSRPFIIFYKCASTHMDWKQPRRCLVWVHFASVLDEVIQIKARRLRWTLLRINRAFSCFGSSKQLALHWTKLISKPFVINYRSHINRLAYSFRNRKNFTSEKNESRLSYKRLINFIPLIYTNLFYHFIFFLQISKRTNNPNCYFYAKKILCKSKVSIPKFINSNNRLTISTKLILSFI